MRLVGDLSINIMYWRKANAIHNWFVVNCQKGVDECQRTYIERSQLVELKDACDKARGGHALHVRGAC